MPNYPPPRRCASSVEEVVQIGEKLSKPTRASHAARHDFDNQLANVRYLESKDPKYPGNSKFETKFIGQILKTNFTRHNSRAYR